MRFAKSLRTRLLLATTAGVAVVLVVSSVAIYLAVRNWLLQGVDDALSREARVIATSLQRTSDGALRIAGKTLSSGRFSKHRHKEFLEVFGPTGAPLARSPSLGDADLPRRTVNGRGIVRDAVVVPGGRPARMVTLSVVLRSSYASVRGTIPPHAPVTLALARSTKEIEENLDHLQLLLFSVAAAAVIVSAGVLAVAVHRGLRPVKALAGRIASVDVGDLEHRTELPSVPAELLPIVSRLEELFDRVAAAQTREKGLIADVAHELRTPLAGLRSTLEVAASRERRPDEYKNAIEEGLGIAAEMQALVENLLATARLQAGRERVSRESVDVGALLTATVDPLRDRAAERGLVFEIEGSVAAPVATDAGKLRIVLRNLLENAVSYADAGSSIHVRAGVRDRRLAIRVANSASSFPKGDVDRVFDRFWRADPARRGGGAHCGIGLPLVKEIVELLGGTVHAGVSTESEFSMEIEIPFGGSEEDPT